MPGQVPTSDPGLDALEADADAFLARAGGSRRLPAAIGGADPELEALEAQADTFLAQHPRTGPSVDDLEAQRSPFTPEAMKRQQATLAVDGAPSAAPTFSGRFRAGVESAWNTAVDVVTQRPLVRRIARAVTPGGALPIPGAPAPFTPPGQRQTGNIDLKVRPRVANPDGSTSTVRSMSIGTDDGEVLIPTVIDGRVVSDDEAIQHYRHTGQHLGIFDTPEAATAFAEALHQREADGRGSQPPDAPPPEGFVDDLIGRENHIGRGLVGGVARSAAHLGRGAEAAVHTAQRAGHLGEGTTFAENPLAATAVSAARAVSSAGAGLDAAVPRRAARPFVDPVWWQNVGGEALGSIAALSVGGAAGKGAAAVAATTESLAEAGSVYEQLLTEGRSPQEALTRATETFAANMAVVGLTDVPLFKVGGSLLRRVLVKAPLEGVQEVTQTGISNVATDRPLTEGMVEAGVVGTMAGAGFGAATADRGNPSPIRDHGRYDPPDVLREKLRAAAPAAAAPEGAAPHGGEPGRWNAPDAGSVQEEPRRGPGEPRRGPDGTLAEPLAASRGRGIKRAEPIAAAAPVRQSPIKAVGEASPPVPLVGDEGALTEKLSAENPARSTEPGPEALVSERDADLEALERDADAFLASRASAPATATPRPDIQELARATSEAAADPADASLPNDAPPTRRRTADQVFARALGDARATGYAGDEATLRQRFDELVESVREVEREHAPDPRAILRAVADRGGLSLTDRDLSGETRWLGEFRDGRGRRAFGTIGGVANVLRRPQRGRPDALRQHGRSADSMLQSVRQDPQFAHFETRSELIEAIAQAKRDVDAGVGALPDNVEAFAEYAGIRPGEQWWRTAPDDDVADFERFASSWDDVASMPAYSEPGERGHVVLERRPGHRRPIDGDEVRSPNPGVEARFEAPKASRTMAARVRAAWDGVKRASGRAFVVEYDLRRAGLDEAAGRLQQFNRDRLEAPKAVMNDLQTVLSDLRRPAQYHAFQRIVMLRRDLELADAMQQGRIPKRDLESGLTPLEARAELDRLTELARREPQILAAAEKHRLLVRHIGDDLVDRGLMRADTRDRNAEYFPGLVLDHLERSPTLTDRPVSPLTPGSRGFLKQAKGGSRETVRDYIDAMGRHLADVKRATMRDDLVTDLARAHDWTSAMGPDGVMPDGYAAWAYSGNTYVVPDALRRRLVKFTNPKPEELRAMNRLTDWWKGATLRVLGVPYELLNLTGDVVNLAVSEPIRDLPKLPGRLVRAARAQSKRSPIKSDPHYQAKLELQRIAALGEQLNLGTGAATADLAQAVRQTPQLRELRRPLDQSTAKALALLPRDAYRRAVAMQDRFREFRENVPRLAKFMAGIERGEAPEVAAEITRRELVDYSALTDVERTYLRGLAMPFYTWVKKNAENWLPGLRVGADGSRTTGAVEAAGRIAKVMAPAYLAALYNELLFPDVERKLSEYDRNRFHLLFPWQNDRGGDGVLYVGFTGPANAAAGLVGLQGFTQRSLDVARGRTTLGEEVARGGRQVRETTLGLVSPILSEPVEQVMNRDLRSGREIVPSNRRVSAGESAKLRGAHAASRFAPISQVTRSAAETTGAGESVGELARRLLGGNLVKPLDVDRLEAQATDRAVAKGERAAGDERAAVRAKAADALRAGIVKAGPERAAAAVTAAWDGASREERALFVQAVRAAADEDRRFLTLLAQLRTLQRSVSDAEAPYVAEELRRSGIAPARSRPAAPR